MESISRFSVPPLDELPDDVRARIEEVNEKSGFVPNVFVALSRRPNEFRAFVAYHDAIMERPGGLSKMEREMIVVATSAAAKCLYCVIAHGAILRVRAKDPRIADRVATNYRHANLSARHVAMLDYALKLSRFPDEVTEADLETLRGYEFEDDEIWDISSVVAFFALSNRMAHAMALVPNDEFYLMGRVPRELT